MKIFIYEFYPQCIEKIHLKYFYCHLLNICFKL